MGAPGDEGRFVSPLRERHGGAWDKHTYSQRAAGVRFKAGTTFIRSSQHLGKVSFVVLLCRVGGWIQGRRFQNELKLDSTLMNLGL